MEEYRVDIKVRNNLILRKIESLGYKSPYEFCHQRGISYVSLLRFTNMKNPIFDSQGRIKPFIKKLCDTLNCLPEELFTATQMEASLETNKRTLEVKEAEMRFLLDQQDQTKLLDQIVEDEELSYTVKKALSTLSPREEKVIRLRFEDDLTLEETAKQLDVTRERIRQIEAKALRKLKHPDRYKELKEFYF